MPRQPCVQGMMAMATHQLSKIVQTIRKAVLRTGAGLSDGQLLGYFIEERSEAAFTALVHRHGPLVWGVCRRILAHHQDAEDAFQATFLVLARKAASIQARTLLANWLYGVAHRTALKARAVAERRARREKQVTTMPEPQCQPRGSWRDLEPLLDQELARLPDKYRVAVLLCDLEGKTGKDAAHQLKIPEVTLASRLRTARMKLASALARHGVTLPASALAAALSKNAASAGAPADVMAATAKSAALATAGKALAAGMISAKVAALTKGVMKAMLLAKLKTGVGIVLTVMLLGGLTTWVGMTYADRAGEQTVSKAKPGGVRAERETGVAARQKLRPDPAIRLGRPPDPVVVPIGQTKELAKVKPAGPATKPKAGITVGKDTTWITGPLDEDGYVDYVTALNNYLKKGVTPENNANVLFLKAMGPRSEGKLSAEFYKWLGIDEPPGKGDYLVRNYKLEKSLEKANPTGKLSDLYKIYDLLDELRLRPWKAKDHPAVADWLKQNAKPLALAIEGSKRSQYYMPLIPTDKKDETRLLIAAPVPSQGYREIANALSLRANLHLGEGRTDEAWQDLLACHRLGRLAGRGGSILEWLIGLGIDSWALDGDLAFVEHAGADTKRLKACLKGLDQLPPMPDVADKIDVTDRLGFIDTATALQARGPMYSIH